VLQQVGASLYQTQQQPEQQKEPDQPPSAKATGDKAEEGEVVS